MKKLLVLILTLMMAFSAILPAAADIIFEPEDAFYTRHRDECDYVGRSYLANGVEGYVKVYSAPGSLVSDYILNGESVYVSHRWEDKKGAQWGVTQDGRWMELSELALLYNWQSFEADFGDEFLEYDGSGDGLASVCLYSYPGGVYVWTWDMGQDFSEAFQHIYVDDNGQRWGFIGYYMGRHNQWVCLDDPLNENLGIPEHLTVGQVWNGEGLIAPKEPPQSADSVQNSVTEEIYPPAEQLPLAAGFPLWVVPVVLVIAVAIVTAVMVRKRRK